LPGLLRCRRSERHALAWRYGGLGRACSSSGALNEPESGAAAGDIRRGHGILRRFSARCDRRLLTVPYFFPNPQFTVDGYALGDLATTMNFRWAGCAAGTCLRLLLALSAAPWPTTAVQSWEHDPFA